MHSQYIRHYIDHLANILTPRQLHEMDLLPSLIDVIISNQPKITSLMTNGI